MNKLIALSTVLTGLLLPTAALAAVDSHYVTQDGAGTRDGSSLANAFSVADFNSAANWDTDVDDDGLIGPGDTVYFSGTVVAILVPEGYGGTEGNVITLDGWEGGSCDPVANHERVSGYHTAADDAVALMSVGQAWTPGALVGLELKNITDGSSCTITDNDATTVTCALSGGTDNDWDTSDLFGMEGDLQACPGAAKAIGACPGPAGCIAIELRGSSYLTVQDFEVAEAGHGIYSAGPESGDPSSHVTIRRNYVHDIASRGIVLVQHWSSYNGNHWGTIGGAPGDGNFVHNVFERGRTEFVDSAKVTAMGDDLVVSYNEIGSDWTVDDNSMNVLAIHNGENQLIEYNTLYVGDGQSCLAVKEPGGANKIVRFNQMWECEDIALSISSRPGRNEHIYVYGNRVFKSRTGSGIRAFKGYEDVYFWSNIVFDVAERGMAVWKQPTSDQGPAYVYHNTIVRAGQDPDRDYNNSCGFYTDGYLDGEQTLTLWVGNNIVAGNDVGSFAQLFFFNEQNVQGFDHDLLFYEGQEPLVFWADEYRTVAWMQANTDFCTDVTVADPEFVDADGADDVPGTIDDDLRVRETSPARDAAVDPFGGPIATVTVQGVDYVMDLADALDPNLTDWTTTPPTVATVKRDVAGWTQGAYAWLPPSDGGGGVGGGGVGGGSAGSGAGQGGSAPGAEPPLPEDQGDCGCRLAGRNAGGSPYAALLGLLLTIGALRRRR